MAPGELCLHQGEGQHDTQRHLLPGILTLCFRQALPAETVACHSLSVPIVSSNKAGWGEAVI